jgi:predicted TIM-barrel fold metal-dependent hydrolase
MTNSPDAPLDKLLSYYRDKGCKGLGEVMLNVPVMHPMVQNLFRHAEKVGLPVIFDGSDQLTGDFGLYDDPGLPQLEHTLQRFPKLIMFGHGPVFWSEIGRLETPGDRAIIFDMNGGQVGRLPVGRIKEEGVVPILFRRYPNLYGDLSDYTAYNALARDDEYGPKFLEEFQDRIFFGTDMCSPKMEVPLTELLINWRDTKKISETVFNKVARENAIKLLGL